MSAALDDRAADAFALTIKRGAALYSRSKNLGKFLDIWTLERITPHEPERTKRILDVLAVLISRDRALMAVGHWSADGNRLIALLQAQAAERAHLSSIEGEN